MAQAGISISELMLEDLILTLDEELTDELGYRELARGRGLWKLERREAHHHKASSGGIIDIYPFFIHHRHSSNKFVGLSGSMLHKVT